MNFKKNFVFTGSGFRAELWHSYENIHYYSRL